MIISEDNILDSKKFKDHALMINDQYDKTLFGSYSMKFQSRFFVDNLSMDFLLNYRVNNNKPEFANSIQNFSGSSAKASLRTSKLEEEGNFIVLPKAKAIKGNLNSCLLGRRSIREYEKDALKLNSFSSLLFYALGIKDDGEEYRIYPRSYASGGGLYPISFYFYANNVENLEKGFYKYNPYNNSIIRINMINSKIDTLTNVSGIDTENYSLFGIWVYEMRKNQLKYGDLGTVAALIEAGEAMQNINLCSYLLNLGVCELGGYYKNIIEEKLFLDGILSQVVGCFVLGNIKI